MSTQWSVEHMAVVKCLQVLITAGNMIASVFTIKPSLKSAVTLDINPYAAGG